MVYDTRAETGVEYGYEFTTEVARPPVTNRLGNLTNLAGAVVSIALLAGVGVWGYKLMMRDVTGIPVVRAVVGEMRVRPEEPGGELALNQGLAVNEVAAEGGAAAPADRLVLAPQPVLLTEEDMPMDDEAVAIVQQAIADQQAQTNPVESAPAETARIEQVVAAVESGSVEDMVAALTEGVAPLDTTGTEGPEVVVQAKAVGIEAALSEALSDLPGVTQSLRPQVRPARLAAPSNTSGQQETAAIDTTAEVEPASLPSGTRLAQLGAYDTPQMARDQWAAFSARFGDLLSGKNRVIEEASSGGRQFYRLRAQGFEDLADARRFCSAIVAEGADCIPVVTR